MFIQKSATVAKNNLKTLMVKVIIGLEPIATMQVNIVVLHMAYLI